METLSLLVVKQTALFMILALNITLCAAQPVHCRRPNQFIDPKATLKILRSNNFMIIDASNQEMIDDDATNDDAIHDMIHMT